MPLHRATVRLERKSGIARDAVMNVWHFESSNVTTIADTVIRGRLTAFYNALAPRISNSITRQANLNSISIALLTPGAAGREDDVVSSPTNFGYFTLTAAATAGTTALPAELATALSFAGDYGSLAEESGDTRPRSRRRGRVFLGPLTSAASAEAGTEAEAVVTGSHITAVLDAYNTHIDIYQTGVGNPGDPEAVRHVIYSPTNGTTAYVQQVWMDNAFDVIRSRGQRATQRTTIATDQP